MPDHDFHADQVDRVVATYSTGEAARRASLGIEQLGIESSRVQVDADSHLRPRAAESKADAKAIERPRHNAAQGMLIGGVLGALVGAAVGALIEGVPLVAAIALFAIPGVALGGLFGVYSRLQTNTEVTDADTGGYVVLTVDLTALDRADRAAAVDKLRAESPTNLESA
jgi:hypothetical protein